MSVYEKRVGDVLANDTCLVNVHVVDVINEVNTATLAGVGWLDNPHVLLAFVLLQLLVVVVEVTKLIGQDVSVRRKVKTALAESFLHSDDVEAESILASDLVTLREVVNLLVLIETLVLITL